jgi:hypothetical protein
MAGRLTDSRLALALSAALACIYACGKSTSPTSSGNSAQNPPSQSFTLSGWNLTLPIDSSGGTGGTNGTQLAASTISTSQLTSGFVDSFFYADSSGRLVFTAPSNGAVTTPGSGSDHTRSELRELYSGPGADGSNDWNSAIGGTLTAACTVQSVSVDSDDRPDSQSERRIRAADLSARQ